MVKEGGLQRYQTLFDEEAGEPLEEVENRYEYENNILKAVSRGDVWEAKQLFSHFSVLSFEKRTQDSVRNLKNFSIVMNTLLRKAVEQGGVHPVYIHRVSTFFAKKIEGIHTLSAGWELMMEMVETYCGLVREYATGRYSSMIGQAVFQIDQNPEEAFSLEKFAVLFQVTPAYFSTRFKREVGKTMLQYVNEKRIEKAKTLLKTGKLQIQTVAQQCGFLDLNYFCRVFKKIQGKTPTDFRCSVAKE